MRLTLGRARAELNGRVAIRLGGAVGDDFEFVQLKNGNRDLLAVFHEKAGHADLFGEYTRAQHIGALLKL